MGLEIKGIAIVIVVLIILLGFVSPVAGTPPPPKYDGTIGVVSIGFDHGFYSQWNPMMYLSSKNFSGTVYVVANRGQNINLFPWSNLHTLYNLGFEMASHSRLHLVETNGLSNATLYSEIYGSKIDLENQGFNVCGFIPPTLGKNATTMAVINKFYNYSALVGINQNTPSSMAQSKLQDGIPYLLVMGTGDLDPSQLGHLTNFTQTKFQIDKAIQNKSFLHIHFHDIVNSTSDYTGLQYPVSFSWYIQTIDYLKQKSDQGLLKVETLSQAMGLGRQCEIVTDKTPPLISVPSDITTEATLSSGAMVNYAATATDNVGLLNGPSCNPSSGTVFPKGSTTVTCTDTDWAGNIGTRSFVVSVIQDTIPPSITVPANLIVQATLPVGAKVNYNVNATDDFGVTNGPTCNPPSGSTFSLGNTTVTCTASDAAGNVGSSSFVVSVANHMDSSPPSITVPADFIIEATSSSGAKVNYTVTATDNAGVTNGPTCNPPSGSFFTLGNTTVACTASDAAGNLGTNSFVVTVKDKTPPEDTVPEFPTALPVMLIAVILTIIFYRINQSKSGLTTKVGPK